LTEREAELGRAVPPAREAQIDWLRTHYAVWLPSTWTAELGPLNDAAISEVFPEVELRKLEDLHRERATRFASGDWRPVARAYVRAELVERVLEQIGGWYTSSAPLEVDRRAALARWFT